MSTRKHITHCNASNCKREGREIPPEERAHTVMVNNIHRTYCHECYIAYKAHFANPANRRKSTTG